MAIAWTSYELVIILTLLTIIPTPTHKEILEVLRRRCPHGDDEQRTEAQLNNKLAHLRRSNESLFVDKRWIVDAVKEELEKAISSSEALQKLCDEILSTYK